MKPSRRRCWSQTRIRFASPPHREPRWFTITCSSSGRPSTNHAAVDAVLLQREFTYLNQFGVMMQEDDTVFTDAGAFIPLRLNTSWLSLAGLQGFQRAYHFLLLGECESPHQLLVKVAYDFNDSFVQENYIDATALCDVPAYGKMPVRRRRPVRRHVPAVPVPGESRATEMPSGEGVAGRRAEHGHRRRFQYFEHLRTRRREAGHEQTGSQSDYVMLRRFKPRDCEEVLDWYKARGIAPMYGGSLPELGYIILGSQQVFW